MHYSKALWGCSFLACVLLSSAQTCPPTEEISPCTCKPTPAPATTTCRSIREIDTLKRVFENSLDHPMPRLVIENSHFAYFPAAALKNKSIQHLEIQRSVMVGLFNRIPEENHKLRKLKLYVTKVLRVEWRLFKNLRKLTHLQISGSRMGRIGDEFRDNMPTSIEYLMLTRVARLQDRVFDKLTRATHLQVSDGMIKTLKRTMFPKENRIHGLGFNNNRISHLPDDIFSDMPKLEVLYLDGNLFTTLSESVFKDVYEKNVKLTFTENKFLCDCSVRWILLLGEKGRLDAKCSLPASLEGKSILEIPAEELFYCKKD